MGNIDFSAAFSMFGCDAPGEEPGDYTGEDGLLYCGKCHTRKQTRVKDEIGRFKNVWQGRDEVCIPEDVRVP